MLMKLTELAYRRRRLVVAAWVLALLVAVMAAGRVGGGDQTDYGTPGSESRAAHDLLDERFPTRAGDTIEVVWTADDVEDPIISRRVERLLDDAAELEHVIGASPPQFSADATIGRATLQLDTWDMPVELTTNLLDAAEEADGRGLRVELAGQQVQNAEQGAVGSEGIGFVVAALILLVAFGSVLAMGLPIMTALFGLGVAATLIALLAHLVDVPDWATSVASMIGIGVGIDYALFIVTRYRSGLRDGLQPQAAVADAMGTAGRAVLFAGGTVMISLLGMVVMRLPYLHGVAFGSVIAVGIVMAASVTLLPAVLGFVGDNIDRLRVPFVGRGTTVQRTLSYRWSRIVQRHPALFAMVGLLALIALAAPALGLRLGFPDAGNGPDSLTSRRAYDLLTTGFGPGFNGTLLVVADLRAGGSETDLERLHRALAGTDGVATLQPAVFNPANDAAVVAVAPTTSPQASATEALLEHVRTDVIPPAVAGTGIDVHVGGLTAGFLDQTDAIATRLPFFIAAVIGLSFLLLLTVFRSLLVALKAAIMNLLSIGAAYGVVALVVNGGWAGDLVGIHEATPVPSFIPMMMFAVLFGLSMDYEVFLLSRVREEYVRTRDNRGAVADGLAHTARVITAAAAIMVAVFLAFVPGDQVFLKVIGIGMATAIFVDATLVRLILVPATMELLGDRNWWLPGWLDRLLPRVHFEGAAHPAAPARVPDLEHAA